MFYLWDNEAGELETYDTLDEAIAGGEMNIQNYRDFAADDGWGDVVLSVYEGPPGLTWADVVELPALAKSAEKDRVDRPEDVDDDGYSESLGDHWMGGDFDYVCDYHMVRVS